MGRDRQTVTSAPTVTRHSESWPLYDVRHQCAVTGGTIIALIALIALIAIV